MRLNRLCADARKESAAMFLCLGLAFTCTSTAFHLVILVGNGRYIQTSAKMPPFKIANRAARKVSRLPNNASHQMLTKPQECRRKSQLHTEHGRFHPSQSHRSHAAAAFRFGELPNDTDENCAGNRRRWCGSKRLPEREI